jgi:hypothetical protein
LGWEQTRSTRNQGEIEHMNVFRQALLGDVLHQVWIGAVGIEQ